MQIISTFVFFDRHWETMAHRMSNLLAGDVGFVIDAMTPLPESTEISDIIERAHKFLAMTVTFEPGRSLGRTFTYSGFDQAKHLLARAMDYHVGKPFDIDTESVPRRIILRIDLPEGLLTVNVSHKRMYSVTYSIFLMWMVGSSLILFAIAIVFMRNQIRSVRRLADAARRFGIGRDVADFKPEGALEVRQAAEAFRQMQRRIRNQIRQRTEMLAGVSHDLRTPLTRMKLQLAMLEDSEDIERLKYDVNDMERMVDAYLAFARGEGTETPVSIGIMDLVSEVVEAERRHGADIAFTVSGNRETQYEARPQAFKRAIANLVVNAGNYGNRAAVSLEIAREHIRITIDDDGPGIPPERREDSFKPFFRHDASRNPATGSVGLGLTIARDIVRSHGGELTLDDAPLGGLRAQIVVPL